MNNLPLQFDEFGNYIGDQNQAENVPDLENMEEENDNDDVQVEDIDGEGSTSRKSRKTRNEDDMEEDEDEDEMDEDDVDIEAQPMGSSVVLYEDKENFPSAKEVFGENTEILVQEEDIQPIEEPIIQNIRQKQIDLSEEVEPASREETITRLRTAAKDEIPKVSPLNAFKTSLLSQKERCRNIALVGHLHHGKTSTIDFLKEVENSSFSTIREALEQHAKNTKTTSLSSGSTLFEDHFDFAENKQQRYTDIRQDERDRKITIKSKPVSFLFNGSSNSQQSGKSYLINVIDTPGHPNFEDEIVAALRISDGAILVVDVLEGPLLMTKRVIDLCIKESVPIILYLNKLDRLILELKLPPKDAFFKIRELISSINALILSSPFYSSKLHQQFELSPRKNNVLLGSSKLRLMFSLRTWCENMYGNFFFENTKKNNSKTEKMKDLLATFIPAGEIAKTVFANNENSETVAKVLNSPQKSGFDEFFARCWGDFYVSEQIPGEFFTKSQMENKIKQAGKKIAFRRTFEAFVLEPIYKIFSHVIGLDPPELISQMIEPLKLGEGFSLKALMYLNTDEILKLIFLKLFLNDQNTEEFSKTNEKASKLSSISSPVSCLVDSVVQYVPNVEKGNKTKMTLHFTGELIDNEVQETTEDSETPKKTETLIVQIVKCYHKPSASTATGSIVSFDVFGRVLSGTLKIGQKVQILGETFSSFDPEDRSLGTISNLWLYNSRNRVPINEAFPGNLVLIEGLGDKVNKTATLTNLENTEFPSLAIMRPLQFANKSVMKVSIEPLNPSELPKMISGLRNCQQSYPMLQVKKEESGEYVLMGSGELYLDCVLHDLRTLYTGVSNKEGGIEVKVSDPVVLFCETVMNQSSMKVFSKTPNKDLTIHMIAEPLEQGAVEEIENERFDEIAKGFSVIKANKSPHLRDLLPAQKKTKKAQQQENEVLQPFMDFFKEKDWNELQTESIWGFGPIELNYHKQLDFLQKQENITSNTQTSTSSSLASMGPSNILLNETLPFETNPQWLEELRPSIISGFTWATKEGPLCEEPIRNVKFKLLNVDFYQNGEKIDANSENSDISNSLLYSASQAIPTTRKVVYSSFLLATPRLMEPIYYTEIYGPYDCVKAIYEVLQRRRGHVVKSIPIPGTPLFQVEAFVPVLDSFGFETDIRSHTQGQAFCLSVFHHWAIIPGDPLDESTTEDLGVLEPARGNQLGRDCMVKTRKRKGLSEDVVLTYFDEELKEFIKPGAK